MDPYASLFGEYVVALRSARDEATTWWLALNASAMTQPTGSEAALREIPFRWPCGPVSHPRVLAVFREFYLRCDAVNESLWQEYDGRREQKKLLRIEEWEWGTESEAEEEPSIEEPRLVLIDRVHAVDKSLGLFIQGLLFVPIGMDGEGRTV